MKKVLIVDEKSENLYLLQTILEAGDFTTVAARNGAEALGIMRLESPDLIISDILMPVMDGFTFCRECKKDDNLKLIPFFFYTATYTDEGDKKYALGLGADRFLIKPQEPEDLLKEVKDFLNRVRDKMPNTKKRVKQPENVVLREYNEVLVRKLEDKMLQSEKTEKELRNYAVRLESEIKERQKIEDSLSKSQLLFKILAENSPVGIFRTTSSGETTYVNPKWCELSGISQSNALGNGWLKGVHPEDRKLLSEKWLADSGAKMESKAEYRFLKPDGSVVWVIGDAVPEIVDNNVTGYVGTITDITERKLSEEKLKSSETRLKVIFENAPDAYYMNDLKGNIVDGNIAAENLMGYKKGELKGKNLLEIDILSASDVPKAERLLVNNSLGKSTGPDMFMLKRKDGSIIAVEITTHPVMMDGQILVLGIARDISERIKAEEALIESETKYRQLVTQSPEGIFISDLSGNFISVNRAICERLKYSEQQLLRMSLFSIVPEKYHSLHRQRLARLLSGESTSSTAEYEVVGKDGQSHLVEVLSVPYVSEKKIIGFQGIARDISDRKRMENQLRESEEKYRRIFENIQDTYYETSLEGIILEVSPSVEVLSKGSLRREGLIGKSIYDFYSSHEERDTLISELINNGTVSDYEVSMRNLDGSIVPCSISAKVIKDEKGAPVKIVGSMHDITDRRASMIILKESEARFRSYFETSLAGIAITSTDTAWIDVNETLCLMLGYDRDDLLKTKWTDITFPDDLSIDIKEFERVLKGETEGYIIDKRFIRKDGNTIWTSLSVRCLRNPDGNVNYFVAMMIDITERKRMEEELKNNQHLLSNALKIANMGAWEYDFVKDVFVFNDLFYNLFHTSAEKESGYRMSSAEYARKFVHPDDIPMVSNVINQAIETDDPGYSPQIEHRILFADGHEGYVNVRFSIIKDKSGNTIRSMGVNQDITGQKKTMKELISAKEKAEESDRLKTAFLHNISHEIRTPLNAIIGFSTLLSEPDIDENSKNSFITTIVQSSDHLLSIINDIIEISNFDAGIVRISKNEIEVNQVIRNLYNQYKIKAEGKGLQFDFSVVLPDAESKVVTDKTKLIQIISNLINNAFKFTSIGRIRFGYNIVSKTMQFFVSDTGIGINREESGKIFDRFYQVDHGIDRQFEGTGLGLSICKAYVTLMGGDIWVSSTPGKGSTFYFTIPFEHFAGFKGQRNIAIIEKAFVFNERKKILIAEDIDSNYKLISYFLKDSNAEIIRAGNGVEALNRVLSGEKTDLILMDIRMPEMDGYEATRKIREAGSQVPIIAQTAYADDKAKALDSGCNFVLTKPFDKHKLLSVIFEYLK